MQAALSRLLGGHRSIRRFAPAEIPRELVREVCEEAVAGGSSSGNLNSATIVATADAARRERLQVLHGQPMIGEASLVLTLCADQQRTRRWMTLRNAAAPFGNLLGYHYALIDAVIVAQNLALGFEARGYGVCFMGTTLSIARALADALSLPEYCVPVTSLVVGVAAEEPPRRDRLPIEALLHWECHRSGTDSDADLLGWFARREGDAQARLAGEPAAVSPAGDAGCLAAYYASDAKYPPVRMAAESRELARFLLDRGFAI